MTLLADLHAAIKRRDPSVTYECQEFDIDGHLVICTYRASDPYYPIACRDAPKVALDPRAVQGMDSTMGAL